MASGISRPGASPTRALGARRCSSAIAPWRPIARPRSAIRRVSLAFLLLLASVAAAGEERALPLPDGETLAYRLIPHAPDANLPGGEVPRGSALGTARRLHEHLAAGDLEEAAALSNAPKRRYEVLRTFRDQVGAAEFKRLYAQYLTPESWLLGEAALGAHRLLVWDLGPARHIAGEYYVEVDGKFLLDDVPSPSRAALRRVLEGYRSGKGAPGALVEKP